MSLLKKVYRNYNIISLANNLKFDLHFKSLLKFKFLAVPLSLIQSFSRFFRIFYHFIN